LILFSDLHAHNSHPVIGEDFIYLAQNALRQIRKFSKQSGDKIVIHLGDWSHLKDRIYNKVWNTIFKELKEWEQEGIVSYWLKGNHDFDYEISIKAFNSMVTAYPIIKPEIIVIEGVQCIFLPYGSTREDFVKLGYIDFSKPTATFIHDNIKGITKLANNIIAPDGWDLNFLGTAHFVFAGHAHQFQEIVEGKVFHIGSPYQVSFNEVGQEKHFLHFTKEGVTVHNFDFPHFVELDYDRELNFSFVKNSYVKVKYSSNIHINSDINKFKKTLLEYGALKVKAEAKQIKANKKERMELKENITEKEILEQYISKNHGELDKNLLFRVGSNFMEGANA
jgi:DNA repair exonuclease SbcCD nuclease subunit